MTARAPVPSILLVALLGAGCGGGAPDQGSGAPEAPAKVDRNACHLLSHEEVSALVEQPITMADQTEAGDDYSTCDWETADGNFAFGITAYWSGGKAQWDAWRAAQGLGEEAFQRTEGVSIDSLAGQGPVPGLGDAAYFSELLPSLVLKGDVLLELKLVLAPRAGTKFKPLATMLLARLE